MWLGRTRTCPCSYPLTLVPACAGTCSSSYLLVLVSDCAHTYVCWYPLTLVPAHAGTHSRSYLPVLVPAHACTCPCWYVHVPVRAHTHSCSYLPVLVPTCTCICSRSYLFEWEWVTPPGIGLGSPRGGGEGVVSSNLYVSKWLLTCVCPQTPISISPLSCLFQAMS